MKELIIQVRLNGKHIATAMTKNGFDDSASSTCEVIGILQNLLIEEQSKLKTIVNTNVNHDKDKTN
jgi:hypothetical protein